MANLVAFACCNIGAAFGFFCLFLVFGSFWWVWRVFSDEFESTRPAAIEAALKKAEKW